jgi:N-acetylmuramoyl-L-alanine amidase
MKIGANPMTQTIKKIYLHWTATDYQWAESGHYHTVILGDGSVKRLTGYDQPLGEHTARRNEESVAIAIACMGERPWIDYPPTQQQIESLCRETAQLAFRQGWQPKDITIARVMTHAEAAANRDFPLEQARKVSEFTAPCSTPQVKAYENKARALGLPHENYGPTEWFDGWPGGFCERWDLWQLKQNDRPGEGGIVLREKIQAHLQQLINSAPKAVQPANPLKIYQGKLPITVGRMLGDNRCYGKVADLAKAYGMAVTWNNQQRFVNLRGGKVKPKYLDNPNLATGYPVIDIFFNRPEDVDGNTINDRKFPARPVMQGILLSGSVYVLVADFCQEFGIELTLNRTEPAIYLGLLPAT